MEKVILYAPKLVPLAMAGNPVAIALLAAAGISVIGQTIKDNK